MHLAVKVTLPMANLQKQLIDRLARFGVEALIQSEGLSHPPGSTVHPTRSASSSWIELRFERAADLDEVVRLVKVALDTLPNRRPQERKTE